MSLSLSVSILAACSTSETGHPGTGGTTGGGGTTTPTGGTTGSTGGTTGSGGTTGGGGTSETGGTTGSTGGASGGSTGSTGGAGGGTGSGGATATGGSGGSAAGGSGGSAGFTRFMCPAGPFGAQMRGNATAICKGNGFAFRYDYVEGPTWISTQHAFFFSNFIHADSGTNKSAGDIIKATLNTDGSVTCEQWLMDVGCNGLAVSATGKLLGTCHGPRAVMEYDPATKAARTIADNYNGKMLESPNDLIADSRGNIYFSNPDYELGGRTPGGTVGAYWIDPTGKVTQLSAGGEPNGVALSPDETKLYIVQAGVWTLDDKGVPTKTNMGAPGGDGLAVDCAGRITADSTNSAYGGPDGKTLIIVSGSGINAIGARIIPVTVPGLP
ncbi:MAG TPA: SMP-30/gluconolactonase/LRE family protein [Polyangia bacterium]|nr:SMP-30/gluconolactonase/LRE family protein [Polyangia bacterium]